MQGLMYRLAELDADSAGQVRVIDYFDALILHGADTSAMMRASATIADCVVGMDVTVRQGSDHGTRRCDPQGRWSPQPLRPPSLTKEIVIDDVVVGTVWIERMGTGLALDEMLVDRMALTAAILLRPRRPLTNAEHTRNLLFPADEETVDTSGAALGLDPAADVRLLAYDVTAGVHIPPAIAGRSTPVAVYDTVFALVTRTDELAIRGVHMGISLPSTVSSAHRYVGSARFARSQASNDNLIVDASALGALNLLSSENTLEYADIPDLVCAAHLVETESGAELMATFSVYLRAGTLRSAADRLHLHHSSVALRLAKLSQYLGFAVDAIENRPRATAMMMLHYEGRRNDRRMR
ncbi:helix-turn-helix domain-containing protein [Rhodococcus qingshengii]|uniref:helix-turn-helix domain-containing protein n=1 Tax=Rhodococcus qingshengii TaxID=334542 RepID=UPI0036DC224B